MKIQKSIQNEKQEPLLLEIQSFLGAIEGKNEQIVKSQEAVNVTKLQKLHFYLVKKEFLSIWI